MCNTEICYFIYKLSPSSFVKYEYMQLSSRRELATIREIRRIQAEVNHPCHSLLPDPREHPYELRQNNLYTVSSKTERHKQSFIARSIKYI